MNKKEKLLRITVTAVMTALATVIYLIFPEIPIVPSVDYLKIDLSDIPAVIASVLVGGMGGFWVELIKNIFHLVRTTTFGIGEAINVGVGTVMSVGLVLFMKLFSRLFSKGRFYISVYACSAAATILCCIAAGWLLNLVLTPLYLAVMGIPITKVTVLAGVWGSTLLNTVKAALNLVPFYPVYLLVDKSYGKINR